MIACTGKKQTRSNLLVHADGHPMGATMGRPAMRLHVLGKHSQLLHVDGHPIGAAGHWLAGTDEHSPTFFLGLVY